MLNKTTLDAAQEILDNVRMSARMYKGDEIGTVAWFRTWVEVQHGFEIFVEAEVTDWDVTYTLGPVIHEDAGIITSEQAFTNNRAQATRLLAETAVWLVG